MTSFISSHQITIQTTASYLVLALSFQIAFRTGVFSFASIGFFGIGAYMTPKLMDGGVPVVPAMLVTVIVCAFGGFVLALPFKRLRGLYLGMATFAFDQIVTVVAQNGGSLTGGSIGLVGIPPALTTLELVLVALFVALLISQMERRSLGRVLQVIRRDEWLALSLGIEVNRHRTMIVALSAALGGLAGTMYVFSLGTVSPDTFGFNLIVSGLTMAVVGGTASWRGAFIGAILVVWFPIVFTFISGTWESVIFGALVILVVTFEPGGILGLCGRLLWWLRNGRRTTAEESEILGPAAVDDRIGMPSSTGSKAT